MDKIDSGINERLVNIIDFIEKNMERIANNKENAQLLYNRVLINVEDIAHSKGRIENLEKEVKKLKEKVI